MNNGISVYTGLNCSLKENLELIDTAASLGLKRLFTSVLIPEAAEFQAEFATILIAAVERDFEIIIDVTPETIADFDFALDFEQITPRLDDGFNPRQIAALSRIRRIMLNASTITKELLITLADLEADFSNISALHNFYPHIYTGLELNYFLQQNHLLKSFNIAVGAFVASLEGRRRPPFEEGLPTVEITRNFTVDFTARYLTALGVDFIMLSDSLPTLAECSSITKLNRGEIILEIHTVTSDATSLKLLSQKFQSRPEISDDVIRTVNSRTLTKELGLIINPDNAPQPRDLGDITIDNSKFGRYMGEVQIVKSVLPPDSRINLVAQVSKIDLPILNILATHTQKIFSFRFV